LSSFSLLVSFLGSFFPLHLLLPVIQQLTFLLLRSVNLEVKPTNWLNIWRWSLLRRRLVILTRLLLELLRWFILTQIIILWHICHVRSSKLPITSLVQLV
jgi:hypothetical protein